MYTSCESVSHISMCTCMHECVCVRNDYVHFDGRGLRSVPEIHPLFHGVVYLYLVARNPLQHEQILGGGRIIYQRGRDILVILLVFMCHEWCRF